jgi:hypothetical protein
VRKDLITLSRQEHERWQVIRRVMTGELGQREAGEVVGVTDRQIRNLVRKVKEKYRDFKPKFAAEKLWKREKIRVSDEKLRQIMNFEAVYPAMSALDGYIRRYGIPQRLYVDKHSTYKTTREPSEDEEAAGAGDRAF